MAGGRLVLPATDPVLTSGGLLNVGAHLTVYQTGTTTLASLYADVGLTTPIANPQTSNSAGRFYTQSTTINVDTSAAYDCVLALTDGETFTYTGVFALGAAPTISGFAPINSPTFTGTPQAPTPASSDASAKIATTQFVATNVAAAVAAAAPAAATTSVAGISALATGAQVVAGTDATHAVTPASLTTGQSLASPGYITHPGGLIEQWGTSPSISTNTSVSISFPTAFSTVVYGIHAMPIGSGGSGGESYAFVTSVGTASFSLQNAASVSLTFYWRAIGK